MYGPPSLTPSDLAELACRVGGAKKAARLLGITPEILLDWERTEGAPLIALRLLWYATPPDYAAVSWSERGSAIFPTTRRAIDGSRSWARATRPGVWRCRRRPGLHWTGIWPRAA